MCLSQNMKSFVFPQVGAKCINIFIFNENISVRVFVSYAKELFEF